MEKSLTSLWRRFVNYGRKKFIKLKPGLGDRFDHLVASCDLKVFVYIEFEKTSSPEQNTSASGFGCDDSP